MLARLARSSYRHRRLVVLGWLVGLVLLTFVASSAGSAYSQIFRLSGTDSQAATDLLQTRFPSQAGSSADIVFKATAGATAATGSTGVKDPAIQARLNTLFGDVGKLPQVGEVLSPFAPGGAGQISADGTIGYATVNLRVDRAAVSQSTKNQLQSLVRSANGPGLQVEGGGDPFTGNPAVGSTELIGLLAAVVILLIAFGSLLAMGLPILTALFGIGTGFAVVGLLSHLTSVPSFATQLAAMIGLGVGIDYALFIVTRYRQGLHAGLDPETAVVTALDTAGRAVVFAGSTVVISLLGMLLIGIAFIGGLGVGAAAVVAVTMLASVTLLPALLGFVGHTIDKLRIPGVGRQRDHRLTVGYRWGRFLQRHPWPFVVVGLVTLLALALPVLSIRLGSSDESNTPTTQTTRRAYDLKAQGFGAGASGPLILAAEISGSGDLPTLQKLTDALSATPGVAQAAPARLNPAGNTAVIQV
ncbi:MAG: putative drug exporter of the superfamily, partial [Acidimicrobiaceae bacterium]|nr:putative drug exporter of the superfamily [Acidimicrobiaceae bacterium]